ncbi:hypothetical protein E6P09_04035 [Haloferax mediterranei ATCC 33500]|uniref:Zinc ribbon domain-containing protein n=1 Tax=Haloferax mediterranei (strain ATCC 33500 / DSM 1411 / JCM 8866 / NBRC 14739 / NCIMB 2177 / R-4) TaxID=523841 RepID=M0J1G7_HALMT|nr:hypothetical protein [Haloferax mediterranei]AHZ22651.1 hypothetical protein BM92_08330 [Haloferax mediterranei ATCC 33500]EMA02796.1 hypothetical protein C439_09445 [Haloferax mediterranei ATCC 33500]MDX5988019.1 hypothetical protein [Haloferax mediterranei ATCC 33500]QCQ74481.1 hypothetical protein E6P09_04035 [Haloferax mediterranei ATCC 33500]
MAELVAWLLLAFVWFIVSVWAGLDAAKHSPHNAFLWGFSVFVGGLLGLALYLNLGRGGYGTHRSDADTRSRAPIEKTPSRNELVSCPNCHAREEADRDTCRFCGEPLDTS